MIERLIRHPIAADLLMLIMIVAGIWGYAQLNTQFLPPFDFKVVTVRTLWVGASPEDVEKSITAPLEQTLRTLDSVSEMSSTSAQGMSNITIDFAMGTDIASALNQVKEKVDSISTLPPDSETPVVSQKMFYEKIATLLVTGFTDLGEARRLSHDLEKSLLAAGIAKVEIRGLPEEEIAVEIPAQKLFELHMPIEKIAHAIAAQSQDVPAGTVGRHEAVRQLRTEEQGRDTLSFQHIPIQVDSAGRKIELGEIAHIERRDRPDEPLLFKNGKPAVELIVQRTAHSDALEAGKILNEWLIPTRASLPSNIHIDVMDERWEYIAERLQMLFENGVGGFLLVVAVLYLFLSGRVAFWIAAGIPSVFLATLAIMYLTGQSLNMLSLFALIMMLGIVVDDAIVVGEEALTLRERGDTALDACVKSANSMRAPVLSASLTTIAAFMPLLMLTDLMGDVLFTLPAIVIITLTCSLFESFFILPGHLYHAFKKDNMQKPAAWRAKFDARFAHFRDEIYKPFLRKTLQHRGMTVSIALSLLIISLGLVIGGRVPFTFFPSPEASQLTAYVRFSAGTPAERVKAYMNDVEEALYKTEAHFGGGLIQNAVVYNNVAFSENTERSEEGAEFGTIVVELIAPDARDVRNPQFISHWHSLIPPTAYLDNISIESPKTGVPGADIDIALSGGSSDTLKSAAMYLSEALRHYAGVYNLEDDLPFGRTQWIVSLTAQGRAMGLTTESLASQLRTSFEGQIVQTFYDQEDELEVRVSLPDSERNTYTRFEHFPIHVPSGKMLPLSNVATLESHQGMQALRHKNGVLSVHVTAEIDPAQANANRVLAAVQKEVVPELKKRFGVEASFEGTSHDQDVTLNDMKQGTWLGMLLIYLILSWVLSSYRWPFMVLTAIPFGLAGAIFGHWLLGLDLTLLSLFGLFGLAGIVINDSIILVLRYFEHRDANMSVEDAALFAGTDRLRAVLLTSVTTIVGLLPLIFETSIQAQFLIPMAVAMTFGLTASTIMVLIVLPSFISYYETWTLKPAFFKVVEFFKHRTWR
jgi:multidrug efflux pump subunit AcrB